MWVVRCNGDAGCDGDAGVDYRGAEMMTGRARVT